MQSLDNRHQRKARVIGLITVLVLAGAVAFSLLHSRPAVPLPQQARFLNLTHSAPGAITNSLGTNYAAFLREWSAAGTNVALFSVTNQQRFPIILYPALGFFNETNTVRARYQTMLLNAPSGYGVFLQPGQAATLEVAVLPGQGPGWVRFGYTPDYKHFIPRTFEMVRGLVRHKPADFHTEWFFSDRIEP